MMMLSPAAKAAWVQFQDAIEAELCIGGELFDVRDIASKTADNATRLAALFQTIDGTADTVGPAAFEGASQIAAWHLNESRRFFSGLTLPTRADADCQHARRAAARANPQQGKTHGGVSGVGPPRPRFGQA